MRTKNLTRKTIYGFAWQVGGGLFKAIIQILILAVLARLIEKADFGVVQAALITIGFAKLMSQLGVGPALVQCRNLTEAHIRSGETFTLILGICLTIAGYATAGVISAFFQMPLLEDVLKLLSVMYLLEGSSTISQSLLLRDMRQRVLVKIDIISYAIGYGLVTVGLAYMNMGIWALVYGQLAQSTIKCALSYVVSYVLCGRSLALGVDLHAVKDLLKFGGGFTVAQILNYIANNGDNLVAGKILGPVALGIYSRAYTIMVAPVSLVGLALDKALFPAFSARQNDIAKLREVFVGGCEFVLVLCVPASIVMYFSADTIVRLILGEAWAEVVFPLQILAIGLVFRMGYKMGSILTKATGHVYRRSFVEFVYAGSMLVFNLIGVGYGIEGVAVATLLSIFFTYILMISVSLRALELSWMQYLRNVSKGVAFSFAISVLIFIYAKGSEVIYGTGWQATLLFWGLSVPTGFVAAFLISNKLPIVKQIRGAI